MSSLNFKLPFKKNSTDSPKTTRPLLEELEELLASVKSSSPKELPSNSASRIPNDTRPEVLDFFSARFHNRTEPFVDHIKDRPDQILAVHNYYVRPSERYESVWAIIHPTINTVTIIHDHPFNVPCEGGWAKNKCKIKPPKQPQ